MRYRESKQTGQQLEEVTLNDANLIHLAERQAAFAGALKELFGSRNRHACRPQSGSMSSRLWFG